MESVQAVMWKRYGDYLTELRDEAYRNYVFDYIAYEDSPRPLLFQIDLLREVGFCDVDILHKNNCFAAFGAVKREDPIPRIGGGRRANAGYPILP